MPSRFKARAAYKKWRKNKIWLHFIIIQKHAANNNKNNNNMKSYSNRSKVYNINLSPVTTTTGRSLVHMASSFFFWRNKLSNIVQKTKTNKLRRIKWVSLWISSSCMLYDAFITYSLYDIHIISHVFYSLPKRNPTHLQNIHNL